MGIHKENTMWRWRTRVMHPQTKEYLRCQKLEERRGTDSSLVPSEGAWPHQFLDMVLLASRTETINLCRFKPIQGEKGSGGSNSCYPAHRDGRPGVLWDPRGDVPNPLQ